MVRQANPSFQIAGNIHCSFKDMNKAELETITSMDETSGNNTSTNNNINARANRRPEVGFLAPENQVSVCSKMITTRRG